MWTKVGNAYMNKFQRARGENNSITRQTTKFNHWDLLKNGLKLWVHNHQIPKIRHLFVVVGVKLRRIVKCTLFTSCTLITGCRRHCCYIVSLYFCTSKKRFSHAIVNVCLLLLYHSFAVQAKVSRQALPFSYFVPQSSTYIVQTNCQEALFPFLCRRRKGHVINVKGLARLNKKCKNNVKNMIDFLVKTVKPTHYQFLQS